MMEYHVLRQLKPPSTQGTVYQKKDVDAVMICRALSAVFLLMLAAKPELEVGSAP